MMKKFAYVLFLITFISAFLYGLQSSTKGDYNAYKVHWDSIMVGNNPWNFEVFTDKDNAYGPVYTLFGIPYAIHPNLPRMIFIFAWAALDYWMIGKLLKSNQLSAIAKVVLLIVICLSPFLWIRNVYYSQFDIVVALLMILAIDAAPQEHARLSGGLASLAVALKYYPLVLVPLLSFRKRKPVWQFICSFTAMTAIIYGVTMAVWGLSFLKPLTVASERPSKLLSIFRVFRGPYSPFYRLFGIENLDAYSTPLVLIGVGILLLILLYREMDMVSGALLVFTLTLMLYKVGHQQFHVSLYLLLLYWLIVKAPHQSLTLISSAIYILFMNVADVGYFQTTFLVDWDIARDLIGVPAFLILGFLFLAVLLEARIVSPKPDIAWQGQA